MFLLERSTKPRYRPGLFCILQEGIVGLSVSASDPAMMSGGLISNSSLSAGLAVTAAPITPPALVSSPQSQPVPTRRALPANPAAPRAEPNLNAD